MKKGLLGSTALIGAAALLAGTAGVAGAAEAPEYKLSGGMNFQVYLPDQDVPPTGQDNGIYFGVDEAELVLTVSGAADNGLNYGFKIELNANTDGIENTNADEARLQLSGSWGTLQMGDEDGAEDSMNYGGENVMGATGGFDGDQDNWYTNIAQTGSFPTIKGDTSDHTKITYYSPRFSGLQIGASWTPNTAADGDEAAFDGGDENHFGLGVNYDNSFGDMRIRASAVYSMDTAEVTALAADQREDTAAFSVGGIVGFGPFSVGVNYTDNGESDQLLTGPTAGAETSYWNAAVGFESGPLYVALGYMDKLFEVGAAESTYTHLALTVDYSVAPGLGVYAEYDSIESDNGVGGTNDGSVILLGANVSF